MKEIIIYTGFGHLQCRLEKCGVASALIRSDYDGSCVGILDFDRCKLKARKKEVRPGVRSYNLVVTNE